MSAEGNYQKWTKVSLIQRIAELEAQVKTHNYHNPPPPGQPEPPREEKPSPAAAEPQQQENLEGAAGAPPKKPKGKAKIDPSRYSTRFIALKLAYLGKRYGGFEYSESSNLPTIEEELWNALTKAHLIFPKDAKVVDFECCEYSKCGRTDRGVSSFGQVISLRPFDDVKDEICYPRVLNRLLPPDIRILAWCPTPPPDFSARFSCGERRYKYFFTQPAFLPEPGAHADARVVKPGWLDIEAMRDAAKRFEGTHDFRNFCKVDPCKLLTHFIRILHEVEIEEGSIYPKVYSFNVNGSAFLYHQIRHMIGVLFLVGQGLEHPSIVTELLDIKANPARPSYNMAHDTPLVLWDCIFPEVPAVRGPDSLNWVYVDSENTWGHTGLMSNLWQTWHETKVDEVLANQLLRVTAKGVRAEELADVPASAGKGSKSTRVYEGGHSSRLGGAYVPVMKKHRGLPPEEVNDRYAKRKGFANSEEMRSKKGPRRLSVDESMADE
ncbi:pseudouridine synthase [Stachybotrys elegans]|uniref:tRNA pseudouridine synthase n=1 Tax=Stachybotrys elegans TaxID=80388 RepID=A0A8K0SWP3_9HYPO|nr:pseudouridine synthase [Stachybotrys elegans]